MFGEEGDDLRQFRNPVGMAFGSKRRLFVSEYDNHRVQVFTHDGKSLGTFGKLGGGPGGFNKPVDIDIGTDDRLYVAEFGNRRVQIFKIR